MKTTINTPGYIGTKSKLHQLDDVLRIFQGLYNEMLEERMVMYRCFGKSVDRSDQGRELTALRKHNPQLSAISYDIARGTTVRRIDRAFQEFYARCKIEGENPGFPRFKPEHRFRTLSSFCVKEPNFEYDATTGKGKVKFKGLPDIRFKLGRESRGRVPNGQIPCTIHIKRKTRGINLSMVFDIGDAPKIDTSIAPRNPVGIDVGITERAALSSGDVMPKRVRDKRREKRRKRLQRKMNRQWEAAVKEGRAKTVWRGKYTKTGRRKYHREWVGGKPSKGYRETRDQLKRLGYRDAVRNRNEIHRWTTKVVRAHDGVAVEDLQIKNMMKSAKGTQEEPGKNVAQKRGLNRSIQEQSWSTILAQLEYKAERAGIPFEKVDPKHTSQTCSACGSVDAASRKRKKFHCVHCGYEADADYNASVNIRFRGFPDAAGLTPRGRVTLIPPVGTVVPKIYSRRLGEQIPLWNFHGG